MWKREAVTEIKIEEGAVSQRIRAASERSWIPILRWSLPAES